MRLPAIVWGAPEWLQVAAALAVAGLLILIWSYARGPRVGRAGWLAALLKSIAVLALAACLLEPRLTGSRPRPGANQFAIVVDDSQSQKIRDQGESRTRGEGVRHTLAANAPWRGKLARDFDERDFRFAARLEADQGFTNLTFDGPASALDHALEAVAKRFHGLPLAGILLFTDGCRTDPAAVDFKQLPPIYPVPPPARPIAPDVGLRAVAVNQSNFEAAPVIITARVEAVGFAEQKIAAVVKDETGKILDRQELTAQGDDATLPIRFQFRPAQKGISFVRVLAFPAAELGKVEAGEEPSGNGEQTLENNSRLVVVDQGGGPYRVLYVSGRPNWEYKFLRRAVDEDEQVQLVGLVRIAKRQPKFDFRASGSRRTSPLFEGFDHPDPDAAERADQPVLVRLETLDEVELRDGFPKTAEELFRYHAIVIDDLEARFFTADQQSLVRRFVAERGGGFLMLGGIDSFAEGRYDRTPIGELLPVYLDSHAPQPAVVDQEYRLTLTREGWLEPWVRLRKTEDEEKRRLAATPPFRVLSHAGGLKPGAEVLAEVKTASGETATALAAQPFGKGRAAALLIGDLWRASLRRQEADSDDFDRMWRQIVRWLVADVPDRLELKAEPRQRPAAGGMLLAARIRDPLHHPLDNARASFRVTAPGGGEITLEAEPDPSEPGLYTAAYVPKIPGAYRVHATASGPDGAAVGERDAGWAAQPAADEFARLAPDRDYLRTLADKTGGEIIEADQLDAFVDRLRYRPAPVSEPWSIPLWHNAAFFLTAMLCLIGEWALRRTRGLP